jgi:hypothetical protein
MSDQTEARSQDLLGKLLNNVNELIFVRFGSRAETFGGAYM